MASLFGTAIVLWIFLWTSTDAQNSVCPNACDCLYPMVDCSERGLTEIPQDLPVWVEILDLRSNEITEIAENAFRGFGSIKQLDLSENKLGTAVGTIFKHLPDLSELKLAFNSFTEIPDLSTNPNITRLILHHNKIAEIHPQRLERLRKLKDLDLSHNVITELPLGTFRAGPPLENLFLSNNLISWVDAGLFVNVTSLLNLKMNKNSITIIKHKPFIELSSLQTLELMRNRIGALWGMNFQGLTNLRSLKLRKNKLVIEEDAPFYGLVNLEYLQLDGNRVSVLDHGLLYGLSSIKNVLLSRNVISRIVNERGEVFPTLEYLDISKNKLSTIVENAFQFVPSLKKLYLNNNKLRHVEEAGFRSLAHLQVLELANNHLSAAIEDIQTTPFKDLSVLERLGLQNNHIQTINRQAFTGLENLKGLFLENNNISTIEDQAFDVMTKLVTFHMNTTKLVCDCQMRWLPSWLERRGFQGTVNARCAYPTWMLGKDIMTVSLEEFICKDSPKPVMTIHPKKQGAIKGSNVTLECAAASSSSTPMRYQWKKDNKDISHDDTDNYAITNYASMGVGDVTLYTSSLHIKEVGDDAEGKYHCVLTNDFGAAYSHKAQIDVHVFPVITKIPGPIKVKAGSSARLECAATGHPKPEVAWQKDGGNDFPAARERRLEMKNDDMFVIKDVNIGDQGVYSCTATNTAGTVIANATLTVLQAPGFVKAMSKTKYANVGNTAVIECLSSGSPKPRVSWFKDGQPLNETNRHFFASNQELLIIVEAELEDQGKYMCEMNNMLGKTAGETSLFIRNADGSVPGKVSPVDAMSTTTGIIVISVVCCVVGTSLIWVIIIYQTRKKSEEYSTTPTDETTVPGEGPEMIIHGDRELSTNSSDPSKSDTFLEYQGSQGSRGSHSSQESPRLFGKNGKLRTAAIFPSDVSDDDHHQLTADEHRLAQNSESSIDRLYIMPNSDSDSLRSSHSAHSGTLPFRTFKPQDGSSSSLPRVTDNPLTRFVELHEPSCSLATVHAGLNKPLNNSHNNNQLKTMSACTPMSGHCEQCSQCDTSNKENCGHARQPCTACSNPKERHLEGGGQYHSSQPPGTIVCHLEDERAISSLHHPNHHYQRSPKKCQSNGVCSSSPMPANSPFVYSNPHPNISQRNQSESPLARSHLPSIPASIPIPPCRT